MSRAQNTDGFRHMDSSLKERVETKYSALIGALFVGVVWAPLAIAQAPTDSSAARGYVPTLGDIMGATQLRHFKLWFAGNLRNWELADYELEQIKASLIEAATLYPGIPVTDMSVIAEPLQSIAAAVSAKDRSKFVKGFDDLTAACNACHRAIGRGFIVMRVPTASPFSNQSFSAGAKQ